MLAADPTEPRFVVLANRVDAPDFGCALQVSGDAGANWIPAGPVPKLPEGAEKCYAPEVAFDGQGTLYYLFVGLAGTGNQPMGVFLTTSINRGQTFTPPRRVLGAHNFAVRMAVDPSIGSAGRLHLVWIRANSAPGLGSFPPPPNPIMAAHSDDSGRTFSEPVQVSDPDRRFVVAPALALGPGRTVNVLYYDLGEDARDYHGLEGPTWEGDWSLVLASSRDGGRRFRHRGVVDDSIVPPERVMLIFTMAPASLAVDDDRRLLVAWHDARNGDWDVFASRSLDGGRTWSRPRRLNDDPVRNGRHQYQPRLAVGGDRLDAVFYDRRDDKDNLRNDVRFTSSDDGGATFAPTLKLTSASSSSKIGQEYVGPAAVGLVEFGSRIGLLSGEGRSVAAWTDTRNSLSPRQQDVFSTVVSFPDQEGAGGPSRVLAVAGLGAGVAAVALILVRERHRRRRPGASSDGRDMN